MARGLLARHESTVFTFLDVLEIAAGVIVPDALARRAGPRWLLLISLGFLLLVGVLAFAVAFALRG